MYVNEGIAIGTDLGLRLGLRPMTHAILIRPSSQIAFLIRIEIHRVLNKLNASDSNSLTCYKRSYYQGGIPLYRQDSLYLVLNYYSIPSGYLVITIYNPYSTKEDFITSVYIIRIVDPPDSGSGLLEEVQLFTSDSPLYSLQSSPYIPVALTHESRSNIIDLADLQYTQ
ncbi:hypothetical protein BO71DRAFT_409302 [Aspergillus ellipticus CBS 707.79]|uniref:Uncharacterized protein n=1 Tax=Aspergillus ellipticus CBS 707.79 TaxID=1448320 RepID=A0A319DB81_9EURO|nr:hypothetical protein BO71DRAFT_409302 [Aspergillus ellipticus CBS 707.79]